MEISPPFPLSAEVCIKREYGGYLHTSFRTRTAGPCISRSGRASGLQGLPLEEELHLRTTLLNSARPVSPARIGMSRECLVLDKDEPWEPGGRPHSELSHGLFDDDAIILRTCAGG